MLSGLFLENFKAFGERQVIPFAPITLIFGANSAGKSSIIQALLVLQQTFTEHSPFIPDVSGNLVDLGSFENMVFRHDVKNRCEIGVMLNGEEQEDTINKISYVKSYYDITGKNVGIGIVPFIGDNNQPVLSSVPVYIGDLSSSVVDYVDRGLAGPLEYWLRPRLNKQNALAQDIAAYFNEKETENKSRLLIVRDALGYITSNKDYDLKNLYWLDESSRDLFTSILTSITPESLLSVVQDLDVIANSIHGDDDIDIFNTIVNKIYKPGLYINGRNNEVGFTGRNYSNPLQDILENAHVYIESFANLGELGSSFYRKMELDILNIIHTGPIRHIGDWTVSSQGTAAKKPDGSGFGDRTGKLVWFDLKPDRSLKSFNVGLERLGLMYVASIVKTKLPGHITSATLRLTEKDTGIELGPDDLGVGVSQCLPVVYNATCIQHRTLVIEQPEVHLHPKAQAELGSLFAESYKERSNQFIVETHSEHLILRLQRLIRNGYLKKDDLSVIYVWRDNDGSHFTQMEIDEAGRFVEPWPSGFFDEGFNERFDITPLPEGQA